MVVKSSVSYERKIKEVVVSIREGRRRVGRYEEYMLDFHRAKCIVAAVVGDSLR